ncbi:hypothetical protein CC1_05270 [Coprococcus catus GD/7]|uniref:Uncharacterized protein n=1 Tax=Coprococcus catus GD/7 TaxID=717962 RepID=D4J512_9FIRM|nr:hypothetical protein CC1_05270 [Coprococcus catus GD/7]
MRDFLANMTSELPVS